jgi:hypothetical protein
VALIDGEALIDRTIRSLLDGGVDRVVVVMAPGASLSESRLLEDRRVQTVVNDDPSRGMFSSISGRRGGSRGRPRRDSAGRHAVRSITHGGRGSRCVRPSGPRDSSGFTTADEVIRSRFQPL